MTQTIGNAVAQRDEQKPRDPRTLVREFAPELAEMLPTHVKSDSWVRGSAAALRKGKVLTDGPFRGEFELIVAARNNPQAFVQALRHAASLGLRPGTEQYYLTPRKVKGRLEILGIVGYQGYIELMYNAGAVASVIVETVHETDEFEYVVGRDEYPIHKVDWWGDRGALKGVYAYARMVSGATSRVVVLNRTDIAHIKSKAQGANSEYSPWQTDELSMWRKSAVRQLVKWVPTSVEMLERRQRALHDAHGPGVVVPEAPAAPVTDGHHLQPAEPDDIVDAEIIDDESAPPEPEEEAAAPPAKPAPEPPKEPAARQPRKAAGTAKAQATDLGKLFNQKGFRDVEQRHFWVQSVLNRPDLAQDAALTGEQAAEVIKALNALDDVIQDA